MNYYEMLVENKFTLTDKLDSENGILEIKEFLITQCNLSTNQLPQYSIREWELLLDKIRVRDFLD